MSDLSISANAFEPVVAERRVHEISRPSLSYWQDAWLRLKRNTRALLSLYIVVGLLLFTVLGPTLWRVDLASQNVDQISQPPSSDRTALVVEPYQPWSGIVGNPRAADASVPMALQLAEPATTQSVRLTWSVDSRASGYLVYRNIFD